MPKQPETRFKERVHKDLERIKRDGGKLWFTKTQQKSIRGTPDELLIISGDGWAIELKKDAKGKLTGLQKRNIRNVKAAGGVGIVAYPEVWEQLVHIIDRIAHDMEPFSGEKLLLEQLHEKALR